MCKEFATGLKLGGPKRQNYLKKSIVNYKISLIFFKNGGGAPRPPTPR